MSAIIIPTERECILKWGCEDEPEGNEFEVVHAMDGDLHLRVMPVRTHPMLEHFLACPSASVRIRMPMIGGGRHEHLFDGLLQAVQAERRAQKK